MHWLYLALLFFSCSENPSERRSRAEPIYRRSQDFLFQPPPQIALEIQPYPWEEGQVGQLKKITKEYFRCKGSPLNPPKQEIRGSETLLISDCNGSSKHSLPLKQGKEHIYPILIDLLNHVQKVTKKRVVITSGHRCPDHNIYVDSSMSNQTSEHGIGAEVNFYVQGMEYQPEAIVKILQDYYRKETKNLQEFKRYEKQDTDVSTLPWMNQEIFIKLYRKNEGRNFDNRHPYPYLSLQVRTDRETGEKVIYTWDKAYNQFLRY